MAITVSSYTASVFNTSTTPKTVTSLSWSTGDVIVVVGIMSNDNSSLNTPTNANLTFSTLASSLGPGGDTESDVYIFAATAASSQTGQTIQVTSGTGARWGVGVYVVAGAATGGVTASNLTESALSLTVAAGSMVIYAAGDWNASAAGKTSTTASGTRTEREDVAEGFYTYYINDWVGTSSGTASFGITDYTGWKVSHAAVELTASTAATTTPTSVGLTSSVARGN